jgi:ankyrin repeat protein
MADNIEIVKYLMDNGAKIDYKDNNGWTALDFAKVANKKNIIDYLSSK